MKKFPYYKWLPPSLYVLTALLLLTYGMAAGRYRLPPYSWVVQIRNGLMPPQSTATVRANIGTPQLQETGTSASLEKIKELVKARGFSKQAQVIDFVREFVYQNSLHTPDGQLVDYADQTRRVVDELVRYSETQQNPPHLLADTRARAMLFILQGLSIKSRIVMVYSDDYDDLQSHTLLEVYNTDTNHWEAQDPDYNLYYIALPFEERISAAQLLLGNLDDIRPVSSLPEQVAKAKQVLMPHYFEALIYEEPQNPYNGMINIERFNITKQFKLAGGASSTFLEYVQKNMGQINFVMVQGLQY